MGEHIHFRNKVRITSESFSVRDMKDLYIPKRDQGLRSASMSIEMARAKGGI